jgi:CheY-like chemotaxis protein
MDAQNKKILIVEDDNFLGVILSQDLGKKYKIMTAQDGPEALQTAIDFKPDLILLDINIPKMDGLSMLEHLRHHDDPEIANMKTIVFTNLTSQTQIDKAKELKVLDYVVKSGVSLEQITKKIEHAFGSN